MTARAVRFGTGRQAREPSKIEAELMLQMRLESIPTPEREYRFHPTRMWRADFGWPDKRLLVECEGGVWIRGRHTTGQGFVADVEKYNAAVLLGYRLLRFTADMVKSGAAITMIREALAAEVAA